MLTAGTGQGKSTLLLAPLLAKCEVDSEAVGLSVAPTKALGEDQVCTTLVLALLYAGFLCISASGTLLHIGRAPWYCNQ